MLEETDFAVPFPAGLLHTVAALVWKAVKAEPAVKAPESAAAEPTETVGVWPVFVVVTPSKPYPESRMPAADVLRRLDVNINAAHKATTKVRTIAKGTKRDRALDWGADLDIKIPLDTVVLSLSFSWRSNSSVGNGLHRGFWVRKFLALAK